MRKKMKSDVKSIDDWVSDQMSAYEVGVFEDFVRSQGYSPEKNVRKGVAKTLLRRFEEEKKKNF